ncbi:hypothetical protein OUZ56_021482 [Daphnia magna]|uniref:Uncharacterized protein n=1 Tax=Daphnia magna TaxID=35525 RepID=A0ABQ9ZI54_9CRUS|nr:hypothetical protein OUZ56_021482 [Daphnia magna]
MAGYARKSVPVHEVLIQSIIGNVMPQLRGKGAGFWEADGLVVLRDGIVQLNGVVERRFHPPDVLDETPVFIRDDLGRCCRVSELSLEDLDLGCSVVNG